MNVSRRGAGVAPALAFAGVTLLGRQGTTAMRTCHCSSAGGCGVRCMQWRYVRQVCSAKHGGRYGRQRWIFRVSVVGLGCLCCGYSLFCAYYDTSMAVKDGFWFLLLFAAGAFLCHFVLHAERIVGELPIAVEGILPITLRKFERVVELLMVCS